MSFTTTPLAPVRQGRPYHEVAADPLGRAKLWLGYGVCYQALHFAPSSWRSPLAAVIRRMIHGPAAEHEDLRALIERGLESDDTTT
jgi:hypothetical protein